MIFSNFKVDENPIQSVTGLVELYVWGVGRHGVVGQEGNENDY